MDIIVNTVEEGQVKLWIDSPIRAVTKHPNFPKAMMVPSERHQRTVLQ